MDKSLRLFWLSFCDPKKPKGSQFLGACIVPVPDSAVEATRRSMKDADPEKLVGLTAIRVAYALGVNPGGEVLALEVPALRAAVISTAWICRLMDRAECERYEREHGVS